MALIRRAATEGWDVPGEAKREAVDLCRSVVQGTTKATKEQLAAVRCLIAADQVDARREATAAADQRTEATLAVSVLRSALTSTSASEALQLLTATLPDKPEQITHQQTTTPDSEVPGQHHETPE